MKHRLSLFFIVLFFLPSLACGAFTTRSVAGSGELVNQTFEVGAFNEVVLEGSGKVLVEQGETEALSVQADANIMPLLDIKVRGNQLILGVRRGFDLHPSQSITYHLTVKDLRGITLAGSGSFDVGTIQTKELKLSVPGSGDIKLQGVAAKDLIIDLDGSGTIVLDRINVKLIDASLQGSGDIELQGTTEEEKVVVHGSGNYRAGNLQAKTAKINIPGSADIIVWVTKELLIKIDGSGDIQYYGQPILDQMGWGSGNITALGEK